MKPIDGELLKAHLWKHVDTVNSNLSACSAPDYIQLLRGQKEAYEHVINDIKSFEIKED